MYMQAHVNLKLKYVDLQPKICCCLAEIVVKNIDSETSKFRKFPKYSDTQNICCNLS